MKISYNLLKIHLAVLLFGFSGLFGKWVDQPAHIIVLGRLFFAIIGLGLLGLLKKGTLVPPKKIQNSKVLIGSGLLLAIHWVAFFESIRISTVGIGLLTFSTFPIFTALLEPFFLRVPFIKRNVLAAIIAFLGILVMIGDTQYGSSYINGVIIGVVSGFTFSLLTIYNRKNLQKISAVTLSFYQDLFAFIFLIPLFFLDVAVVDFKDIYQLAVLGLIFTALAHTLFIAGMKTISASSASMVTYLEPVYGIVGAWIFFSERPSVSMLIGGAIIFTAVWLNRNIKKEKEK